MNYYEKGLEVESDNDMNLLSIILLLVASAAAIIAMFFLPFFVQLSQLDKKCFCRKNPICAQTCNSLLQKRYTLTKLDAMQLLVQYIHYTYCEGQKLNR